MDLTIILAFGSIAVLFILSALLYFKTSGTQIDEAAPEQGRNRREDGPRRAQVVRNQRARLRANAAARQEAAQEDEDPGAPESVEGDEKMGAKKRAKLEAKAEKKAQREMEEKVREEKKKREQLADEERLKLQEKEHAEIKRKEEEEHKAREEKERREHEEYLKMKEAFSVEEEGYEEGEEEAKSLQDFINYIKQNKVIVIEDLAAHFKLKTQATIERLQDLQKDNTLSGVIDDRGKFIYISPDELEAVAKFIKQRGRVSITELAESSNKLINLTDRKSVV